MDDDARDEAARLLREAEATATAIAPLTQTFPGIDVVDAYEIQLRNIRRRLDAGAAVYGHKVGLSSKAMQEMMGVDEPDYGHLLDDMVLSEDDAGAGAAATCCPGSRSRSASCSAPTCRGRAAPSTTCCAATEAVVPSIELIDSRIADWKIGLRRHDRRQRLLGRRRPRARSAARPTRSTSPRIDAVLTKNGEQVAPGRSDAVLGDPAIAVAWLARTVARFGVRLRGRPRRAARLLHPRLRRRRRRHRHRRVRRARLRLAHVRLTCSTRLRPLRRGTMSKATAAIVGSGNIGTDLLVQAAALGRHRAALDDRRRPRLRGPAARPRRGPGGERRRRRLAARAGREARPRLRGDVGLRLPRQRARATPRPASARST